jgi:hypothetical protein
MTRIHRLMVVVALAICLQPVGCRKTSENTEEPKASEVEHLDGAEPARVKLTEDAVKRLDIQTDTVRDRELNGTMRKVIPYAAILYDIWGATWTYTNPQPLTYVRYPITVDHIVGNLAFLLEGPPSGSAVVTVGAAELYGAEIEFEEE